MKTVDAALETQMVLYSNINVREEDPPWTKRSKQNLRLAADRYIKSEAQRAEALILNNFDGDSWWCTLTFDNTHLPDSRIKTNRRYSYFVSKLREAGYPDIKYFKAPEHRHGLGRWHIHCIMSGCPDGVIGETWQDLYGGVRIEHLIPWKVPPHKTKRGYSKGLASYITKEAPDILGRHSYTTSRGRNRLVYPEITRRIVPDDYHLYVPPGCIVISGDTMAVNPFGSSQRLSYLKPEAFGKGEFKGVSLGTTVDNYDKGGNTIESPDETC